MTLDASGQTETPLQLLLDVLDRGYWFSPDNQGKPAAMPDRRTLLLGALAAPMLAGRARAQPAPPVTTTQAPGFYRFKVGGFTATTVHDGFASRPVEGLVVNKPLPEVQAAFRDAFLPTDTIRIPFTVTFIDTGRDLIAFDSGNGAVAVPTMGKLWGNMAAAGLDPDRVTHVVMSHFHGDHIGGLLDAAGAAKYRNAEVVVPEVEWRFWNDAGNEARSPAGQKANFANTAKRFAPYKDKVRVVAEGAEVLPGVQAVAAYGHTPGHTCYHIADGGAEMMFVADCTNRPVPLADHPDYHISYDFDGDLAEVARRRIYDRVSADRMAVTGYHFPFPAYGHMETTAAGYHFVPVEWSSAV